MVISWTTDDKRVVCTPTRNHSPESLPAMRFGGRSKQICLLCDQPLETVYIDGMYRWVVFGYLINEVPW